MNSSRALRLAAPGCASGAEDARFRCRVHQRSYTIGVKPPFRGRVTQFTRELGPNSQNQKVGSFRGSTIQPLLSVRGPGGGGGAPSKSNSETVFAVNLNGSVFSLRYLSNKAPTRKTKTVVLSAGRRHHLSFRSGGLVRPPIRRINLH